MFDTVAFWAALAAAGILSAALPRESARARAALLSLVSLLALIFAIGLGWPSLLLLLGSALWVSLAASSLFAGLREARPSAALALGLGPVAAAWILGKLGGALGRPGLSLFGFLGFSFFFIKASTLLKDVQDKRIQDAHPLGILAYFLFFPVYVSGPMHLFDEFDASLRTPEFPDKEGAVDAVYRIALGLFKLKILAPTLAPLGLDSLASGHPHGVRLSELVLAAFVYSFVILFNFSGYSDLAVGSSRLVGVRTPENFRLPYLAPNLREFWQRWHITLSRVLTNYLFVPIARGLGRALGERPRSIMIIAYLVTFLFCGYWHGPTVNFVLWGLYHAMGLIVYDIYRTFSMKQRRKRKGKLLLPEPLGRALGTSFTFAFVSLGWIFFALPVRVIFGG